MTLSARQLRLNTWQLPAALAILAAGAVLYLLGEGRSRVLIMSVAGCGFCGITYVALVRLMPQHYMSRLLVISDGLQLLALAMIAALGLPLGPPYHPFDINSGDEPVSAVLAMLTVPAGALLAAIVWSFVTHLRPSEEAPPSYEDVAKRRRIYLVIAAWIHLLYWPAGLETSGLLGYIGRILATALICAPFLAGRDSSKDRPLAVLWTLTITINACIGIVGGTRSKAFIAAVLFAAGYVSSLPKRRRIALSAWGLLAAVPLIQLAGAVGVVRDELGRGGLELVSSGRISEVFSEVTKEMLGRGEDTESLKVHGVSRLLAWTNVVVPMMTPETVPYRGMDRFIDEAVDTFKVSSVSGSTADDLYSAGLWNAPARTYGFTVNSFTSVEFTLAADGWSRGGATIALLFSFVLALALTGAEVAVSRWHRFGQGAASILVLPIAKAAFFDSNYIPILPTLRGVALYTAAVGAVVVAVEVARHTVRGSGDRNAAVLARSWRRG